MSGTPEPTTGQRQWSRGFRLHRHEVPVPDEADPPAAVADATMFAQLVWAHHRWDRDRRENGDARPELEAAYRDALTRFEGKQGAMEQVYWSSRSASAVAMTVEPKPHLLRDRLPILERDSIVRIHRLSDWATCDSAGIADLLHECDLLAIKVGEVLRGTSERIAMRWILGIEAHLLGFFERTSQVPNPQAEARLVEEQRAKLAAVERYYHRAASKTGRIVYTSGMMIGVALAAVIGIAGLPLLAPAMDDWELQLVYLSYGAGALGALISAMSRMGSAEQGKFNLDFELGRPLMRRLGVYRPFVGAVMGVAFCFMLAGGLLGVSIDEDRELFSYGFLAFLAGFSERFALVTLGAAEKRLSGSDAREPA